MRLSNRGEDKVMSCSDLIEKLEQVLEISSPDMIESAEEMTLDYSLTRKQAEREQLEFGGERAKMHGIGFSWRVYNRRDSGSVQLQPLETKTLKVIAHIN